MTHVNGIAEFRSRRKISKDCRFFAEIAVSGSNAVLSMAKYIYIYIYVKEKQCNCWEQLFEQKKVQTEG